MAFATSWNSIMQKFFMAGTVFGEFGGWIMLLPVLQMTFHAWHRSTMKVITRGRPKYLVLLKDDFRCSAHCKWFIIFKVQQCIGEANSKSFPESSNGMIGKMWLQTRRNGWLRWTILRNVVQSSCVLFTHVSVLARALKRAAFSACEPQTCLLKGGQFWVLHIELHSRPGVVPCSTEKYFVVQSNTGVVLCGTLWYSLWYRVTLE